MQLYISIISLTLLLITIMALQFFMQSFGLLNQFHLLLSWTRATLLASVILFKHHPPSVFLVFLLASLKWVSRSVLP